MMLKDHCCTVLENRACGDALRVLVLQSESRDFHCQPGQFVMVDLPEARFFFRRPFSVLAVDAEGRFEIYYKVVGVGTAMMADYQPGQRLNVLGPLGNAFDLPLDASTAQQRPILLVGGGIGIAPLYFAGRHLLQTLPTTSSMHCFYGVRSSQEVGLAAELTAVFGKERLYLSTDDGSQGHHGNVCDLLNREAMLVQTAGLALVCGPTPMMAAASRVLTQLNPNIRVQVSLEEHMPCGTGACTGCVVFRTDQTLPSKVCVEGPVFESHAIRWDGDCSKISPGVLCNKG